MFIYRCAQQTYWRRCPKRCSEATIRAIETISTVSGNALLQAAGNLTYLSTFAHIEYIYYIEHSVHPAPAKTFPAQDDYVRMDNIRYCDISHPACSYLRQIHFFSKKNDLFFPKNIFGSRV